MKEFLSQNKVDFTYIDITDSMLNLKKFLKYRDSRSEFEEIRTAGRVGLPCVMLNKGEEFLFSQEDIERLVKEL